MTINDDFTNKAETEMKMHDAKMMEQARLRKLGESSIEERIAFALQKNNNDAELALVYLKDNHLIHEGENVTLDKVRAKIKL